MPHDKWLRHDQHAKTFFFYYLFSYIVSTGESDTKRFADCLPKLLCVEHLTRDIMQCKCLKICLLHCRYYTGAISIEMSDSVGLLHSNVIQLYRCTHIISPRYKQNTSFKYLCQLCNKNPIFRQMNQRISAWVKCIKESRLNLIDKSILRLRDRI